MQSRSHQHGCRIAVFGLGLSDSVWENDISRIAPDRNVEIEMFDDRLLSAVAGAATGGH